MTGIHLHRKNSRKTGTKMSEIMTSGWRNLDDPEHVSFLQICIFSFFFITPQLKKVVGIKEPAEGVGPKAKHD